MSKLNDGDKNDKNDNTYSTYLGEKGYSIFKECLSVDEQHYIRNELTMKPHIPKSPIQPTPFPIYLESIPTDLLTAYLLNREIILT